MNLLPLPGPGTLGHKMRWFVVTGLFILVTGLVFAAGCTEPVNQTIIIETGTPDPRLLEDMEYRPLDLPLIDSSIPEGISVSDHSVGILKDGNLLFRGMVTNERVVPIRGYVIVYIEILDNDGELYRTSYPLVSPRDLQAGQSFRYFYVTLEPLGENISSYRIVVQVSDQYPGV